MTAAPASELVPLPPAGRRYVADGGVRLGDADTQGRMRLDAIARQLQDVANDDALAARLDNAFGWVVRRTMIRVARPALLGERIRLTTFCSGTGRSWAERRTSISGDRGASIEAASLWVQVDAGTGRPAALDAGFHRIYGEAAGERRVSSRLSLPGPSATSDTRAWAVRVVDLDVFDHVNNAAQWAILEEALVGSAAVRTGTAEMEHVAPIDATGSHVLHLAGDEQRYAWLTVDGRVHAAARWTPSPP
jgi:acyl-ACP thioesterase